MAHAFEYLWFLNTLVCVRVSHHHGNDGISVLEHTAARGDSPPLHIHVNEDEVFHILEGEFRFRLGTEERRGRTHDTVIAPKGIPHTYRVESERGRWLTVTIHRQFEDFVRAMARTAENGQLPPPTGTPTSDAMVALVATAKRFGIEIVGPPLH